MGYECFTSASDLEAQHSITFTAYKNMPINVVAYTKMAAEIIFTTSVNGGSIIEKIDSSLLQDAGGFYSLIPTDDTATFTFSSP